MTLLRPLRNSRAAADSRPLFEEIAPEASGIRWVHDNAQMPAGRYWDLQLVQNYVYPWATFGKEPMATWLKAEDDELINHFPEEEINVIVVGGETNGYWRIMGTKYRKTVSVDAWR